MEDDAPLSALAAKPPKPANDCDDDTPLATLAEAKSKQASSSKGKAAAKAVKGRGPAAAKAVAKRKSTGDSSSSSSSSDSSSSSSDDDRPLGKKTRSKKREEDPEDKEDMKVRKKDRTPKEALVAECLCRWWYALPDWPPDDEAFYKAALKQRKHRKVIIEEWEWVPELDEEGLSKVYELSQFRGVFRTSSGDLVDIRPKETCPSFSNFMSKPMTELYEFLIKAYENQLLDLKKSNYEEHALEAELRNKLTKAREKLHQARQVVGKK